MFEPKRLLAIGAARGMGAWVVKSILSQVPDLEIVVLDIDSSVLDLNSDDSRPNISGVLANKDTGEAEGVEADSFQGFDVIALCVPIASVNDVARTYFPKLRAGTLVFDICSTKEAPIAGMLEHSAGRLSVIGTHPLFGVGVNLVGQTVVICPTDTSEESHLAWIESVFRDRGALITIEPVKPEATREQYLDLAREHDVMVSITQGLAHFVHYSLLRTLATEKISLRSVLRYQTPIFRQLIIFSARVISLTDGSGAELYASIQHGLARPELRESLIDSAHALESAASEGGSPERLIAFIEGTARSFRPADVEYLKLLSRIAISSANEPDVILADAQLNERLCGVEIITESYSEIEIGFVREVTHDSISFENCLLNRVEPNGKRLYQLVSDEPARKRAAELGFSGNPSRPRTLHRRHLRVLPPEETEAWLLEYLRHPRFDLTVIANERVQPPVLAECLESSIPEILTAMVTETYQAGDGFRITIAFECLDIYVAVPRAREYVTGLGYRVVV
ncbi:MAG: hypothetical protein BGO23_08235 [Solirubrobacterales bacterium 67-14]|nr:MAG: hypothetical protein BGO23_08235 [Solirubrobacterales bacterium 67-14]